MTHLIEQWQRPENVVAIQTSQSLQPEHNFSVHPEHAKQPQIKQLIQSFNLPHEPQFMQQVHGSQVIEYHKQPSNQMQEQADACFTRQPNVICAVMTADCLPVLMTNTKGSFVAAVHCGWRSLYQNILHETLKAIQPDDELLAWFGPCIQQPQYEVGADFADHYLSKHPEASCAFTSVSAGKSHANLYTMATLQLNQAGVTQIGHDGQCTYLNSAYHSWRQNKTVRRMATMIWLNQMPYPK